MVVFEDKHYIVDPTLPNTDFTDGAALYVVDDKSSIAADIMKYAPYYDFIEKEGNLVGVEPTEKPTAEPSTVVTVDDISLALAELAEKQENDKVELEMAIAELAEAVVEG